MTSALMVFQAVISIFLIITVLLQFGKGAEAGLMTAAGSESMMSSSTRGNLMSKITTFLAILFLGNSIVLARLQNTKHQKSLLDNEKAVSRPLNSDAQQAAAKSAPAAAPAPVAAPVAPEAKPVTK
jgi:preprotein translocase subunit SecG